MKNAPAFGLAIALLLLGACGEQPGSIPQDRLAAWEQAFNAGDAAALAALYNEDAVLMPPNSPALDGRLEIEKFMQSGFAQGPARIAIGQDDLAMHGNSAVRRGTYVITTPEGQEVEVGKYVEVWKKSGDTWSLSVDIWNTDAPPPAPAPPAPAAPEAPPAPST